MFSVPLYHDGTFGHADTHCLIPQVKFDASAIGALCKTWSEVKVERASRMLTHNYHPFTFAESWRNPAPLELLPCAACTVWYVSKLNRDHHCGVGVGQQNAVGYQPP